MTEPQHRLNVLILISESASKVCEIAIYPGNPGLIEVIVDRGVDGGKLLQGLHVPELCHRRGRDCKSANATPTPRWRCVSPAGGSEGIPGSGWDNQGV